MPQVGGTEFPYTPSGMRKAERYAKIIISMEIAIKKQ